MDLQQVIHILLIRIFIGDLQEVIFQRKVFHGNRLALSAVTGLTHILVILATQGLWSGHLKQLQAGDVLVQRQLHFLSAVW